MENHQLRSTKTVSLLGMGWLGMPLAEALITQGWQVKGSVRLSERFDELRSKSIEPYIVNIDTEIDDDSNFFASELLIINIPSKNIMGFERLVEIAKKNQIKKIIFVSSTSVYGEFNCVVREEDEQYLVVSPLLTIENLFLSCDQFSTTVVRFAGLIGYSRNPAFFFKSGRKVVNPSARVNLIHRDDCIAILSTIIQKNLWGKVYNCCSDTHPTKKAFYTYAALASGSEPPQFSNMGEAKYKIVSNARVKQDLNYQFIYSDLMALEFSSW